MCILKMWDIFQNLYNFWKNKKITQNKLYVISKSVIITVTKVSRKNLQPYTRKWRLSISENAEIWATINYVKHK